MTTPTLLPRLHPDTWMLLTTVVAFLDEVGPQLQPADRYRGKIAANVLRMVQRELAGRVAADAEERAELVALLQRLQPGAGAGDEPPDAQLAQAIRAGTLRLDDAELQQALQCSVERSLRINNPKWLRP